jgi:hypothetical protein
LGRRHPSASLTSCAVTLFLYQRFCWPSGGYGVCVSVHDLPGAVFGSKDHRSPQIEWRDILPSANLGLGPLQRHDVGKLRSHLLRHDLGAENKRSRKLLTSA